MTGKKQEKVQLRYYEIPAGSYILPLLGEGWIRNYDYDINGMHFHNYLEIGYCYSGEGTLTLGNRRFPYFSETFSIIPNNCLHNTFGNPGKKSYWEYLFIDVERFLSDLYPGDNRNRDEMMRRINSNAFFLTCEKNPRIGNLIQEIICEYREKKDFYLEAVKGYLLALLFEIARLQKEKSMSASGFYSGNFTQIGSALNYVRAHYSEKLKVQTLAEQCNLSEPHFRRLFQEKLQMTPADYISHVRVHAACAFMKDTSLTIEDIAMKTGFISMSTFNRNFRKIMGISPKQWRKQVEEDSLDLKYYSVMIEDGWR